MAVVDLHDRDAIAAVLRRNAPAHVYELGDLDDFDWPYTRWFGWEDGHRLEQVALLYTQPEVPVLIAISEEPAASMSELVREILPALPSPLYVHVSPSLLDIFRERYAVEHEQPHLKLALTRPEALAGAALPVKILRETQLAELDALYHDAYPETWFTARMLATGRYVGVRRAGRLACVAGVHVYSPTWRVAALGNVATLPGLRGQGLAQGACAALCLLLLQDGIETISLNVRADNDAALAAYTRLGFETVTPYREAALYAKASSS
jgi:ribosomal protein S18 acetylase RimI-like enzyme